MTRPLASRRAQRGMALLALLAVAVMVFAYVLTSRLNAASRFVGVDRDRNAMVMAQAKRALIGWMAINAAGTDANPGRLPCPEAPGDFGTVNEGRAASSCLPPNNVGRLPWRTLGLEKLADAGGEPLWYAVSSGWSLPGAGTTAINSDTPGQLALDGVANDVVALIIAPGPAIRDGCSAFVQSRPTAGPPNVANYLECGNATGSYVTSAPGQTFNDQVLRVAATDVIPALEAAVAERMQREIAPALKSAYGSATWGTSAGNPLYPFATPFGNPQASNLKGDSTTFQGLLPLNRFQTPCTCSPAPCECAPSACTAGADCDAAFLGWTGAPTMSGSDVYSPSCSPSATQITCDFYVRVPLLSLAPPPSVSFTLQASAQNVGMGLRRFQTEAAMPGVLASGRSLSGALNPNGSASITLSAQADTSDAAGGGLVGNLLCGIGGLLGLTLGCAHDTITVPITVLVDHPLADPNDPTLGWFVRNRWQQLVYYAAAQHSTPAGLAMAGGLGCTSSDCLRFNDSGVKNIRALLVLGGRGIGSPPAVHPSATLADYLEYNNADGLTMYEQRPMRATNVAVPALNAPWNDRVVLVDWASPLLANQAVASAPVVRTVTLP